MFGLRWVAAKLLLSFSGCGPHGSRTASRAAAAFTLPCAVLLISCFEVDFVPENGSLRTGAACTATSQCAEADDICGGSPLICRDRVLGDPCGTTTDCAEPAQICDQVLSTCQERVEGDLCAGAAQCPGELYCANTSGRCYDGSIGDPCNTTTNCAEPTQICDQVLSTCQERAEGDLCADAAQCPGELYCADTSGRCYDGSIGDPCNTTTNCAEPHRCDAVLSTCEAPGPYFYVLVEDQDINAAGAVPGADIDAVELNKGGAPIYLARVHDSAFGLGETERERLEGNGNQNNVLGPPIGTTCSREDNKNDFFSLGGVGGFFIGSFTGLEEIETGDTITVHVCDVGPLSETWSLRVGVAADSADPNFQVCTSDSVGTASCSVPFLPDVSSD